MTQEEKQLLLKDLCARLPYGVQCEVDTEIIDTFTLRGIAEIQSMTGTTYYDCYNIYNDDYQLDLCKPYLRPMSSMTEEEYAEYRRWVDAIHNDPAIQSDGYFDWLNARHFDYRGLIGQGLALEAPEGMYN